MRPVIHLVLHVVVPLIVSAMFFRHRWGRAALIMLAVMVVDLDHLLADPIYSPGRCSIGYHPLHSFPVLLVYPVLALTRPARLVGVGLVIHMILDTGDCAWQRFENKEFYPE